MKLILRQCFQVLIRVNDYNCHWDFCSCFQNLPTNFATLLKTVVSCFDNFPFIFIEKGYNWDVFFQERRNLNDDNSRTKIRNVTHVGKKSPVSLFHWYLNQVTISLAYKCYSSFSKLYPNVYNVCQINVPPVIFSKPQTLKMFSLKVNEFWTFEHTNILLLLQNYTQMQWSWLSFSTRLWSVVQY